MMGQKIQLKKIVLVITKSNFGGAQKYIYELANGLKDIGHEVFVIAGGNGILFEKLKKDGIKTYSLPYLGRDISLFSEFKTFIHLIKLFKKIDPDVVHLNSSKIGGIGSLAGKIARIPRIIFTGHGWAFNEDRSAISKIIIKFAHWVTILLSDHTIVVSELMKKQVANFPFIKQKITVIPNGIKEIDFFDKELAREKINKIVNKEILENNSYVIGIVGELHPIKGHKYLIDAFSLISEKYPNAKLCIIGDGEIKEELIEAVSEKNLQNNVVFTGFIDEASKYMRAFDVFVISSLSEGLCLVALEAGLAQVPIVSTNVGGIPDLIKNNESGILVEPKNPEQLSIGIMQLKEKPEMASKLAQNLYQEVILNYTNNTVVERTVAIYNIHYTIRHNE